jgi:hypothetical protein
MAATGDTYVQKRSEPPRQQMSPRRSAPMGRLYLGQLVSKTRGTADPYSILCRTRMSLPIATQPRDSTEAGRRRLRGGALREARTDEVKALKDENARLK